MRIYKLGLPVVGIDDVRQVLVSLDVVRRGGVVVEPNYIHQALHQPGLLQGEVGRPLPHLLLLYRLQLVAVGDSVQEPEIDAVQFHLRSNKADEKVVRRRLLRKLAHPRPAAQIMLRGLRPAVINHMNAEGGMQNLYEQHQHQTLHPSQ